MVPFITSPVMVGWLLGPRGPSCNCACRVYALTDDSLPSSPLLVCSNVEEISLCSEPEMASFYRSAIMAGKRSLASRSANLAQKSVSPKSISSPLSSLPRSYPCASRFVSVLGSVETMMPLHSAIASARLKSSIAADSSCWSWLSQGFATPL